MFREQSGRERKRVFDECVFFGEIIKETGFVRSRKRKTKKNIKTKKKPMKTRWICRMGFSLVFLSKIGNSSLLLPPAV